MYALLCEVLGLNQPVLSNKGKVGACFVFIVSQSIGSVFNKQENTNTCTVSMYFLTL